MPKPNQPDPPAPMRLNFGTGNASPRAAALLRVPMLSGSNQHGAVRVHETSSKKKKHLSAWAVFKMLPKEVYIVLLIDLLNSYRSFGFRSVQYIYLVNEFGVSDLDAGKLLGVQAWLMVVFGMLGAMLVDSWGVRNTAITALSVAAVSRGLLAFGQERNTMVFALIALAPFGEAVLSTGIYTVALKKLTTPTTRGLAFSVQYGVFNLAGALADVAADTLRKTDIMLPRWLPGLGGSYWPGLRVHALHASAHDGARAPLPTGTYWSGLRVHVFFTWLAVLAALAVSVACLYDTVLVPLDEDEREAAKGSASPGPVTSPLLAELRHSANEAERARGYAVRIAPKTAAAQPPPLPTVSESEDEDEDDQDEASNYEAFEERSSAAASGGSKGGGAGAGAAPQRQRRRRRATALTAARRLVASWLRLAQEHASSAGKSLLELIGMRAFWRALWLSCCLLFVSKQVLACACLCLPASTCDYLWLPMITCDCLCFFVPTECH